MQSLQLILGDNFPWELICRNIDLEGTVCICLFILNPPSNTLIQNPRLHLYKYLNLNVDKLVIYAMDPSSSKIRLYVLML